MNTKILLDKIMIEDGLSNYQLADKLIEAGYVGTLDSCKNIVSRYRNNQGDSFDKVIFALLCKALNRTPNDLIEVVG